MYRGELDNNKRRKVSTQQSYFKMAKFWKRDASQKDHADTCMTLKDKQRKGIGASSKSFTCHQWRQASWVPRPKSASLQESLTLRSIGVGFNSRALATMYLPQEDLGSIGAVPIKGSFSVAMCPRTSKKKWSNDPRVTPKHRLIQTCIKAASWEPHENSRVQPSCVRLEEKLNHTQHRPSTGLAVEIAATTYDLEDEEAIWFRAV